MNKQRSATLGKSHHMIAIPSIDLALNFSLRSIGTTTNGFQEPLMGRNSLMNHIQGVLGNSPKINSTCGPDHTIGQNLSEQVLRK